jgi:hypothetical protein
MICPWSIEPVFENKSSRYRCIGVRRKLCLTKYAQVQFSPTKPVNSKAQIDRVPQWVLEFTWSHHNYRVRKPKQLAMQVTKLELYKH